MEYVLREALTPDPHYHPCRGGRGQLILSQGKPHLQHVLPGCVWSARERGTICEGHTNIAGLSH